MRALAVAAILTTWQPATAAPTITVKARTRISVSGIHRTSAGIEVRGALLELGAQNGVPGALVESHLDTGPAFYTRTDDQGRFAQPFAVTEGVHNVAVVFSGSFTHTGAQATVTGFDVAKDPVTLTVRAPSTARSGDSPLRVTIRAQSLGAAIQIPVSLYLTDAQAAVDTAKEQPVAAVTTNEGGLAELEIPSSAFGLPGRRLLEVRFSGSDTYDIASARRELLVTSATVLELQISSKLIEFDDNLQGAGRLSDERGKPIAGAPVALEARGATVADVLTDADGQFTVEVPGAELGSGELTLRATYRSAEEWRGSASSEPVHVTVGQPQTVPIQYTIAAFAATTLAVLAFALLRTRPWTGLLEQLRRREGDAIHRDDRAPGRSDAPDDGPDVKAGLTLGRPGLVSTLRRPSDHSFTGTVRDAVTARPIANADLKVQLQGEQRAVRTEASGQFAFDALPAGTWSAVGQRSGYVSQSFQLTVPHRGELRGARIDLLPVREQIFRIYRAAAMPLLPRQDQWGIWTPRQLFDHVRQQQPAPALAALTDFVEETYFSQRLADEGILDEARKRAIAVSSEQPK